MAIGARSIGGFFFSPLRKLCVDFSLIFFPFLAGVGRICFLCSAKIIKRYRDAAAPAAVFLCPQLSVTRHAMS